MTETLAHTATEAPPQSEPITFEQYVAREDERKADLIDGYLIHDMPTDRHEDLFAFLLSVLRFFVNERDLGVVLGPRTTIRIEDRRGFEPDIVFVRAERTAIIEELYLSAAPDLAVEIVSPTSSRATTRPSAPPTSRWACASTGSSILFTSRRASFASHRTVCSPT